MDAEGGVHMYAESLERISHDGRLHRRLWRVVDCKETSSKTQNSIDTAV